MHDNPLALVFDIGAHHGNRTHQFLEQGATCVVAVEPLFSNFLVLRERFIHEPRVIPVHAACSDHAGGFVDLYRCTKDSALSTLIPVEWGTMYPDHSFEAVEFVPATTLEALAMKFGRPTYAKIDVEGVEELVLAGMGPNQPQCLSFEFHGARIQHAVTILEALKKRGYVIGDVYEEEIDPRDFIIGDGTDHHLLSYLVSMLEQHRPAWGNVIVQ